MKIGILTLPLHTNYGGILQAYALQTVLERMGHQVVVFDTPNKMPLPPIWKIPLTFTKRLFLKSMGRIDRIFIEKYNNQIRPVIAKEIQPFVDERIHRKVLTNFSTLEAHEFDAIVVGSDQIWRSIYFVPLWLWQKMEKAYLSFTKGWNIKRISYAASFGTDKWEYNEGQTLHSKEALQMFDAVSVREENGVKLCKQYFEMDAIHVLDPTMLLDANDYIELFKQKQTPRSRGNLLNYVLDETDEIKNLIQKVASENKMIPFAVNNPYENDDTKPLNQRIKPSVETWLRGFYDADFVITDSFHACVFSIIFKKQFIVVGNKERGMARFESLLKMFGLEGRLVDEKVDINTLKSIDYNKVYCLYGQLRERSLHFLSENLES